MADPKHGTTVANVTLTITMTKRYRRLAVLSVDGAALCYYTIDGTDPVIGQDGCHVLPPAVQEVPHDIDLDVLVGLPVIKFKSATAVKVSVRPL
jgi:hypothetical protein